MLSLGGKVKQPFETWEILKPCFFLSRFLSNRGLCRTSSSYLRVPVSITSSTWNGIAETAVGEIYGCHSENGARAYKHFKIWNDEITKTQAPGSLARGLSNSKLAFKLLPNLVSFYYCLQLITWALYCPDKVQFCPGGRVIMGCLLSCWGDLQPMSHMRQQRVGQGEVQGVSSSFIYEYQCDWLLCDRGMHLVSPSWASSRGASVIALLSQNNPGQTMANNTGQTGHRCFVHCLLRFPNPSPISAASNGCATDKNEKQSCTFPSC